MRKIPINFGYDRTKRLAKSIYKRIKKVECPILNNEEVVFSSKGFNHLIRKLKVRSRKEQKKRFRLIPFAKKIIQSAKTIEDYRNKKRKKDNKQIQEWALLGIFGQLTIKLIVKQEGNGNKHFYSIMEDN